jgi:hypothetical protein
VFRAADERELDLIFDEANRLAAIAVPVPARRNGNGAGGQQ